MINIIKEFYNKNFSDPQAAFLAILIIIGFSVVILMGGMLLPVIASIVIAYLLDGVVSILIRFHVPRRRAIWLVFLVFVTALIVVAFVLAPLLSAQLTRLVGELPDMLFRGQKALLALPEKYPFIPEEQINEMISTVRRQITEMGRNLLSFSLSQLPGIITMFVYMVLMPLLVLFFLKDKFLILGWAEQFLPQERSLMKGVWKEMDQQIGNYVRGKFWEMLLVGSVSAIVFSIMGLNYAILLGVLIGLSVFVPYVGAVVVTFPVVIVAYFQFGGSAYFVYIIIAYSIIQALDGSVLVPLLFSEVVNLHPIAIIVAVLAFGGLWGLWGVFFAIPLASFVQVLITAWPSINAKETSPN